MTILSEHDVFIFVAQLGIIIFSARFFGEIAKKFGQPIIVGEVFAGIVLGPSIFGHFLPQWYASCFPDHGAPPYILQGISWLCVLFLLMITGLEIDLQASIRQGKQCIAISLLGLVFALVGVYGAANFLSESLFPSGVNALHLKLMISVALSVAAIPVIAKILFDLNILRSEVGLKVLISGVLSDVWGWILLALVLSIITTGTTTFLSILKPLVTMFLYLYVTLRFGRNVMDKILYIVGYKTMDVTVVLSLMFSMTLLNCAIAHLLGVHVLFGAFIAGVMAGESDKISPYVRQLTQDFIFAVFAPIFFVLIGMQVELTNAGIWGPIILLLAVSSVFKISGAFLGGIWGGMGHKNAFTVACGLNTQGTMGIIVALIALEMKIFDKQMFSIIVIICVLTSILVGPLLKWAIKGVKRPLAKYFDKQHVFLDIEGKSKKDVIKHMATLMAEREIIENHTTVQKAILEREEAMSTAIGEGVALPHARLPNLKEPVLCFFRLKNPIDFSSPDNKPVQLLFLELTDDNDDGMQLNLIAQVARFIGSDENRKKLLECKKEEEIEHLLTFDAKA